MRDAFKRLGGDPHRINPAVPADLVVDHSVQVDFSRVYVCLFVFANRFECLRKPLGTVTELFNLMTTLFPFFHSMLYLLPRRT